jgi:hypothetical protein
MVGFVMLWTVTQIAWVTGKSKMLCAMAILSLLIPYGFIRAFFELDLYEQHRIPSMVMTPTLNIADVVILIRQSISGVTQLVGKSFYTYFPKMNLRNRLAGLSVYLETG